MADPVRLQLLMGPGIPVTPPRAVIDALQEVKVESGSGDTQSGFELTFAIPNTLAAADALPAHGRLEHPDLPRRDRVTLGGTTTVLMDGVTTHHELPLRGGPDLDPVGEGQGPHRR